MVVTDSLVAYRARRGRRSSLEELWKVNALLTLSERQHCEINSMRLSIAVVAMPCSAFDDVLVVI